MIEPQGFITVTVKGKTTDGSLNPRDIDISETKEIISDVEVLLFPTKAEREERPKVSYEVKEGSVKNIFHTSAAKAIMFTALLTEVGIHERLELLDSKALAIIDKWQKNSYSSGREYEITSSVSPDKPIISITKETKYIAPQASWINASLYLYGKIYEEGGLNKVNLHILTDRYGKLTVSATEEQLTSGENKLFKIYGLWVKGKQNIETGELKDLELIDYLTYQPEYDEIILQSLIEKASKNWNKIKNKDAWLSEVRGGSNE